MLSKATVTATRYTRNVLFYEGPTTQNFTPTVFVTINDVIAAIQGVHCTSDGPWVPSRLGEERTRLLLESVGEGIYGLDLNYTFEAIGEITIVATDD